MAMTTEMAEADLYTELVSLRGLNRTMADDLASLHAKLAGLKVRHLTGCEVTLCIYCLHF
jgi:hypothetical protein